MGNIITKFERNLNDGMSIESAATMSVEACSGYEYAESQYQGNVYPKYAYEYEYETLY